MPIRSVGHADSSSATKTTAIMPCVNLPRFPYASVKLTIRGRTTNSIAETKASAPPKVITNPAVRDWMAATTKASIHHAVTSSTAAQVNAIAPIRVLWMARSVRIRARTGNAVTDIETPRNRANDVSEHTREHDDD